MKYLLLILFIHDDCLFGKDIYDCKPTHKEALSKGFYTNEILAKSKASVKLIVDGELAIAYRCSHVSSLNKVTCDPIKIDKSVSKKDKISFYHFRSGFNVQVMLPNLAFVENNGGGSVAFGSCEKTNLP